MSYADFELEDFLEDSYFKEWVSNPCHESVQFWNNFLLCYPEKAEVVAAAKGVLLSVSAEVGDGFPHHDQVALMWKKISYGTSSQPKNQRALWIRLSGIAASLLFIILAAGWLMRVENKKPQFTYTTLVSDSPDQLIEKQNLTDKPIIIELPDHSKITLEPASTISYPNDFMEKETREVYLLGKAFFQIERNPERPFFVYANELVTKVLGTSFTVKAFENDQQMEVVVKTGRVSVFTRNSETDLNAPQNETILTPNHRVLYSRKEEIMKKYLVDAPEIIVCAAVTPAISDFEDAPVTDILKNIEQSYGIAIQYDEHLLKNCLLTASFTQESLYDKVELICKGIEAEFAIVNAQIVITGRGCN
ncbi:FecR family protein [Dyadobacter luteus]|uniref:FecR family protein n=1 Tax=Dyadobacter luteus TaxID=2259619 RepID=A0A3D8Y3Q1_9BACT|nr:FecR family protein [Dyadobacter luteus]REA56693.1 FecR family protein [Dyadobacter luteus]